MKFLKNALSVLLNFYQFGDEVLRTIALREIFYKKFYWMINIRTIEHFLINLFTSRYISESPFLIALGNRHKFNDVKIFGSDKNSQINKDLIVTLQQDVIHYIGVAKIHLWKILK